MTTERITIEVIEKGARRTGRSIRDLGDTSRRSGEGVNFLTTALAGLAATGVAAVFARATQEAAAFETAIAEVNTLLGVAPAEIQQVNDAALALSREFGGLPTQQVQAFYQAISAGAEDAAEATDILRAANTLAVAGVSDVFTATDALTTVLNAYGDAVGDATDVSDILFTGVREGKTTLDELAGAIGRVAPLAATAGVGFDELVSGLAAITAGGVNTNEAVTGLRAIFANIARPTSEASALAEQLGVDFSLAGLQANGFAGFLEELVTATGGSQDALVTLFGSVEALTPILALTGNASGDFADALEAMGDRAGVTQDAFELLNDTFNQQASRLAGAFRAELIELGQVALPLLTEAVRFLADNLDTIFDIAKVAAAGLLLIIAPNIIAGFVSLTRNVVTLGASLSTLTFNSLVAPLTTITNLAVRRPFGLMAQGLTAAAPAAGLFSRALGGVGRALVAVASAVPGIRLLVPAFAAIGSGAGVVASVFGRLVAAVPGINLLGRAFGILGRAAGIFLRFLGPVGVALSVVIGLFSAFNSESRAASTGLATIGDVFTVVFQRIQAIFKPFINFFRDAWNTAVSGVTSLLPDISITFADVGQAIAVTIDTLTSVAVGGFNAILVAAQNAATGLANALIRAFNFVAEKFTGFINGIIDGLNAVSGLAGLGQIPNRVARQFSLFEGAGETVGEAFARGTTTGAQDAFASVLADAEALAQNRAADNRLIELANNQGTGTAPTTETTTTTTTTTPGTPTGGGSALSRANEEITEQNRLLEEQQNILNGLRQPQLDLQLRQQALQGLLESGQISTQEFAAAMRELNVEITSLDNSLQGGVLNGLARIAAEANNIGQQMSDFVVGAFNQATDAIVNFAKTGQFNVRQFFQDLFAQLLKLAANQLFSQLIGSFLPGAGGLGGGGGLLGGLLGFQNGGSFMVGGNDSRPDSQLVAFRATRGERVDVSTPGQQANGGVGGGGGTTVVSSPPVNVVAQLGNSDVVNAFDNAEGETVIINMLQRNATTVRQIAQG